MSEAAISTPPPEHAIVKWYNPTKGFGFVLVVDKKNNVLSDLFVHVTALQGSKLTALLPQQTIEIERGITAKKRPCVSRVVRLIAHGPILEAAVSALN